jgi:hypothetical protein
MVQKQSLLRKVLFDIRRGRTESFPSCCIAFYALLWGRLSDLSQLSLTALKSWNKVIGDPYHRMMNSDNIQWGRIPCPKCLVKDKLGLP